jgi:predicted CXXCH cytochrome family protein
VAVCGACHADTIRRQSVSVTKHAPVGAGECHVCHDPHGGNAPLLLANPNGIELCGQCHDWQKHSTHPIGDKVKDPRNPNLVVQFPTTSALCTNCHERHKR